MKIGVFDSGLGGMLIADAIRNHLPDYDYVFLGDTLHVPYGKRSTQAIYSLTMQAIDALFKQDCHLIILACNTASAAALRRMQQEYLPQAYPDRRILGVVVPMIETALAHGAERIGLIGTDYLIRSKIYEDELTKINPNVRLFHKATPLLVPILESHAQKWIKPVLEDYIAPLLEQDIQALMLGCTHYAALAPVLNEILPSSVSLLSQHRIIPGGVEDYLQRHPEHESKLSKGGSIRYFVTDLTEDYPAVASSILGKDVQLEHIML